MDAPDILHLDDEAALTAAREARLSATLDRVFALHPFYRRRFAAAGIERGDLNRLSDLARLQPTTKADYVANPDSFALGWPADAPASESIVWDVMYTTGSTGRPTPFTSTGYDFINILALNRNMLRLRGVTERDSILNLFPLTRHPHGAFARAMNAAAAFGIPVVAALPGSPDARRPELGNRLDQVVALAGRAQPTILWGVPSYIRKMVARAEELGVDLSAVRLVFVTGEGFGEEARADLIVRLMHAGAPDPRISVSYGATEMQGGMVECQAGTGYHNPAPDQFYFEAVDPVTHEPVADGEEGLILLTHLDRRGTLMLRYALGDVARLTRLRCPCCGALTERLTSIPRRHDDFVKIKGMLVNPLALADALAAETAIGEFQALVEKEDESDPLSMDRLRIKIVPVGAADPTLPARIAEKVKSVTGVTPVVDLTTSDDPHLAGRGWKTKPLIDLRKPAR